MGETTKPRQFRVPDSTWAAYERICAKLGTTRAEDLNNHIRRQIREHGTQEEIGLLDQGEAELAERRARKGGRPPGRAKNTTGD